MVPASGVPDSDVTGIDDGLAAGPPAFEPEEDMEDLDLESLGLSGPQMPLYSDVRKQLDLPIW